MRKVNLWIAPVCGMLLYASPLLAQTGSETLVETIAWLKQNLGGAACVVFQMGASKKDLQPVTENTEVRFSNCEMTLDTATTIGPRSELRTFHVSMAKFNPTGVTLLEGFKIPAGWIATGEVPSHTIRLATASGDNGIAARFEQFGADAPKPSEYRTAEVNILVRHQDIADKLVIALSRAIALCRAN